ncbi:hypothetical protein GWI33_017487 [Rhynchophorus ferrugineus]|uniref:Uncharacterized protein n=1 Tax=Rhynchophorus ferrugineus TaxID=354439 RepID=A0A834M656_RHYFE|nr:hypothetical protein GWI33_017487 [Rhynchophorus ferrugineus]
MKLECRPISGMENRVVVLATAMNNISEIIRADRKNKATILTMGLSLAEPAPDSVELKNSDDGFTVVGKRKSPITPP